VLRSGGEAESGGEMEELCGRVVGGEGGVRDGEVGRGEGVSVGMGGGGEARREEGGGRGGEMGVEYAGE